MNVNNSVVIHLENYKNRNCSDFNLDEIVTSVKADVLEDLLRYYKYETEEMNFFVNRFRFCFELDYEGPMDQRNKSRNLKLRVGNNFELWNKMMKEVELHRFAGPFEHIPFREYVQSPVGLVAKAMGKSV